MTMKAFGLRISMIATCVLAGAWAIAAAPSQPSRPGPATPPGKPVTLGDITCEAQDASPKILELFENGDFECSLSPTDDKIVYRYIVPWTSAGVIQVSSALTGGVYVKHLVSPGDFNRPGYPEFSPDGNWVSFISGTPWLVRADGTGLRKLLDDGCEYLDGAWSPDGGALVFFQRRTAPMEVQTGSRAKALDEGTALIDIAAGKVVAWWRPPLVAARFSPDGKWLLGGSPGAVLVALRVDTGERRTVVSKRSLPHGNGAFGWAVDKFAWIADSDRVLFTVSHAVPDSDIMGHPPHNELWEASMSQGWVRKVGIGQLLCASMDGRKFLIDTREVHQVHKRKQAKQKTVQPGDLQLLTVVRIGRRRP